MTHRAEHDTKIIKELLETIDIDANQPRLSDLGNTNSQMKEKKYKTNQANLWQSYNTTRYYKNATKLQDAEEHLKKLSIRYDLSKDERNTINELIKEVKQK